MIESVAMKAYTLSSFLDKIAGLVLVSAGVLTIFAVIVAVGVVYNSARIALQERAWELASLRVLGFTRAEVAQILFSQFAIEIALGHSDRAPALARHRHAHRPVSFQRELPDPGRDRGANLRGCDRHRRGCCAASAYIVRRRVDRLDLVAVLKTRD